MGRVRVSWYKPSKDQVTPERQEHLEKIMRHTPEQLTWSLAERRQVRQLLRRRRSRRPARWHSHCCGGHIIECRHGANQANRKKARSTCKQFKPQCEFSSPSFLIVLGSTRYSAVQQFGWDDQVATVRYNQYELRDMLRNKINMERAV